MLIKLPIECSCRKKGVGKIGHRFIHEIYVYRKKKLEIVSHWLGNLEIVIWVDLVCDLDFAFFISFVYMAFMSRLSQESLK